MQRTQHGDPESADLSERSFTEFAVDRLATLCRALDISDHARGLTDAFQRMLSPWGERRIGHRPRYLSNIADDGAPFEFSLAVGSGTPELQIYVEPQGEPPTLSTNLTAARACLDTCRQMGASLNRLREIEDLFLPETPQAPFTLWLGASLGGSSALRFKAYLNPQVRGADRAPELVQIALKRFGFDAAWQTIRSHLRSNGPRRDELGILSLDLRDAPDARLKVYVRHHGATVTEIEAMCRLVRGYRPGDAAEFYTALAGETGPFVHKPPITEFSFVEAGASAPAAVTLEFPLGKYVANDEIARRRITECLTRFALPTREYSRAVEAFARRPLRDRAGLHAHVTHRRQEGGSRVAIYWASEVYGPVERT